MYILRDAQPGVGFDVFAVWEGHGGRGRLSAASVSRTRATGDVSQVSKTSSAQQQVLRLLRSNGGATCAADYQGPSAGRRAHATYRAGRTAEASRPSFQARAASAPAANVWAPRGGKSSNTRAHPARTSGPCCGPPSCGSALRRGDPAFSWPTRAED
jgi:hypothetical protein